MPGSPRPASRSSTPRPSSRSAAAPGTSRAATRKEQSEKADRALMDPTTHIAGTRIAAEPGGKYAIEVLVKSPEGYRPRAAIDEGGLAHVRLVSGDVYGVRLINDSDRAAAVVLTIDGLSMFAHSDDPDDASSRIIVEAGKTALIIGWYRNNRARRFQRIPRRCPVRGRGPEATPPGQARVGMVTATFSVAWPTGTPPARRGRGPPTGRRRRRRDQTGRPDRPARAGRRLPVRSPQGGDHGPLRSDRGGRRPA